ncbi:MAG: hypothetical protein U1E87_04170 [Alphaproteobacteria bacterium]
MLKSLFALALEAPHQADAVEALNDLGTGPGRYAKTAHRLREGRAMIAVLAFVACDDEAIIGSVRHDRSEQRRRYPRSARCHAEASARRVSARRSSSTA